jgi:NADH-quinone oxidoreductase subunit N
LTVLVIVAVINSAISAYYYLRLIVTMFFKERTTDWAEPKISGMMSAVLIITVLGVFYLGMFSDGILDKFKQSPQKTVEKAEK